MPKTRQQIIDEARRIITEIRQIFVDAERWNSLHPDEKPIDPDPHGTLNELLRRLTDGPMPSPADLERMSRQEGGHEVPQDGGW
jgi:hypothetical protein